MATSKSLGEIGPFLEERARQGALPDVGGRCEQIRGPFGIPEALDRQSPHQQRSALGGRVVGGPEALVCPELAGERVL